jgi:hypothetical protein
MDDRTTTFALFSLIIGTISPLLMARYCHRHLRTGPRENSIEETRQDHVRTFRRTVIPSEETLDVKDGALQSAYDSSSAPLTLWSLRSSTHCSEADFDGSSTWSTAAGLIALPATGAAPGTTSSEANTQWSASPYLVPLPDSLCPRPDGVVPNDIELDTLHCGSWAAHWYD